MYIRIEEPEVRERDSTSDERFSGFAPAQTNSGSLMTQGEDSFARTPLVVELMMVNGVQDYSDATPDSWRRAR